MNKRVTAIAALGMIMAGIIHFVVAFEHWQHTPAHGIVFVVIGIMQIIWGVLFLHKPREALVRLGILLAGASLMLWGMTHIWRAPFEEGPEELNAIGLTDKAFELLALLALLWESIKEPKRKMILIAEVLVIAFIIYGFGLIAEPIFPGLGEHGEHHEMEEHVMEGHM